MNAPIDSASILPELCDIASRAGEAILEVYRGKVEAWLKDDASPLTEADLRADAIIRTGLEAAFPGTFILSEESASREPSAGVDSFFLVDPLDGTKEFLKRNDEFTVNIAWIERGEAVAGVVFAPALGEMFWGARGAGAWKRDRDGTRPIAIAVPPATPLRVMGSRSHGTDAVGEWLARLGRESTFVAAGSSLKFCRLAEGRADLYPRLGPTSQWDTAAAHAVLAAAGGEVLDASGRPLRYGLDRPILNPHFVAVADRSLVLPPLP